MTTKEILQAARTKIALGWIQSEYAVDCKDLPVAANSPKACKFCIYGALLASGDDGSAENAIRRALPPGMYPASFNDTPGRTQEEVLALLDKAIEGQP